MGCALLNHFINVTAGHMTRNVAGAAGYAPSWVALRDLSEQECPLSLEQPPMQATGGIGAVAAAALRADLQAEGTHVLGGLI